MYSRKVVTIVRDIVRSRDDAAKIGARKEENRVYRTIPNGTQPIDLRRSEFRQRRQGYPVRENIGHGKTLYRFVTHKLERNIETEDHRILRCFCVIIKNSENAMYQDFPPKFKTPSNAMPEHHEVGPGRPPRWPPLPLYRPWKLSC